MFLEEEMHYFREVGVAAGDLYVRYNRFRKIE